MKATDTTPCFPLGRIVVTSGALGRLRQADINAALSRHAQCDWGEMSSEAWKANDEQVKRGRGTLTSIYLGTGGAKFYVLTEADRSVTTVLLPGEY